MKQSLARLTAWAKKHPYLTAGILAVVLLLGYLAYKRSGSGGGFSAEGGTVAQLPEGSDAAGAIPSMGEIASPVSSGGGGSVSSADLGVSSTTGQAAAEVPAFASQPASSPEQISFMDEGAAWSPPSLGEAVFSSFSEPSPTLARQSASNLGTAAASLAATRPTDVQRASGLGAGKGGVKGGKEQPKDARAPRGTATVAPTASVVKKATPTPKPGRTPAERAGLYWLFSGSHGGIRYAMGYPVGVSGGGSISGATRQVPTTRRARGS